MIGWIFLSSQNSWIPKVVGLNWVLANNKKVWFCLVYELLKLDKFRLGLKIDMDGL